MVTLSTVYRAKGNEAAVVVVVGADASVLSTRTGRKNFAAFTRTKGWLRIFGVSRKVLRAFYLKVQKAQKNSPQIEFTMPDMNNINTIQRGLEEKHARKVEAKQRIELMKSKLNSPNEGLSSLIEDEQVDRDLFNSSICRSFDFVENC